MKHRIAGRKLGRTSGHRKALLRNLSMDLIERERVRTTLAKAKELRRVAEKLVTLSKRETLHARRLAMAQLPNRRGRLAVEKLFDSLSARFAERPGGYTRILKLGPRRGDSAEMALIEFVSAEPVGREAGGEEGAGEGRRRKSPRTAKTAETARTAAPEGRRRTARGRSAAGDAGDDAGEAPAKTAKTKAKKSKAASKKKASKKS